MDSRYIADIRERDRRIFSAVHVAALEACELSDEWLTCIPDDKIRPSPRLVQDLILECVFGDGGVLRKVLLEKMDEKHG